MKKLYATVFVAFLVSGGPARADTFAKGSLIIPMDTDYQDNGMLTAFGLLYQLLKADVPVHWVIESPKSVGDTDFTASATDFKTGATISSHGYRGGPFVIDSTYASAASTVVTAWQVKYPKTAVHVASAAFTGHSARLLTAAPTIAVIADTNEDIAFDYLNAAAIPDSQGNAWPAKKAATYPSSPDVLLVSTVAGTTASHTDGALFRSSGQPAYCQIMTMHWDITKVDDEVVAEYRAFLGFPTHVFAECQAVNAVEDSTNGHFLTTTGLLIDNSFSGSNTYLNSDSPFAQMDGGFEVVSGSERAYSIPTGGKYKDANVTMITNAPSGTGERDIWMTGYLDGLCSVAEKGPPVCASGVGKVSYLGGHHYDTTLPLSANKKTQGTRLFLNSLFEAGCVTSEGQPIVALAKTGTATTWDGSATYTLSYANTGPGPAISLVLTDTLPTGATYVSSTGSATASGSTVTWEIGDLAAGASGSVEVTVSFSSFGTYSNSFSAAYTVGINARTETSNTVSTSYAQVPEAGIPVDAGASTADSAQKVDGAVSLADAAASKDHAVAAPDSPAPEPDSPATAADSTSAEDGGGTSPDGGAAGKEAGASANESGGTAAESGTGPSLADTGGSTKILVGSGGGCDCGIASRGSAAAPLFSILLLVALLVLRRAGGSAARRAGRRDSPPTGR